MATFPHSLFNRCFIAPSGVVFHHSLLQRIGLFETSYYACEDLDYFIRAASAGVRFIYVKGCHVQYRKNHAEALTGGTCRLTETFAKVLERHHAAFPGAPTDLRRKAAYLYFGAAWCHATTSRELDSTADPRRVQPLLQKAWELNRRKAKYWIHSALIAGCERLQSDFLRDQFVRLFKPRKFVRVGQVADYF